MITFIKCVAVLHNRLWKFKIHILRFHNNKVKVKPKTYQHVLKKEDNKLFRILCNY